MNQREEAWGAKILFWVGTWNVIVGAWSAWSLMTEGSQRMIEVRM